MLYLFFTFPGFYRVFALLRKPTNFPVMNWAYWAKTLCHLGIILSPIATILSLFFRSEVQIYQATYLTATVFIWVGLMALIALIACVGLTSVKAFSLVVMNVEYSTRSLHNWILKAFWTGSFLLSAVRLQTVVGQVRLDNEPLWEAFAYAGVVLCLTALCSLGLFYNKIPGVREDDYHKLSDEERQNVTKDVLNRHGLNQSANGTVYGATQTPLRSVFHEPSLEDRANIFSQITYYWLNPLLDIGNDRVLEDQDLPALTRKDTADYNGDLFESRWREERAKGKSSITMVLARCYGLKFLWAGVLKLAQCGLVFVGPYCLNKIVAFIEESENPAGEITPLWKAFCYVGGLVLGSLVQSLCLQWYFFIVFRISMQVRSATVIAVYNKAFQLNNASRQSSTVGEIVNHMSIDTQRIMDLIPYLHQLWSGPLQILICLIALGFLLGWSLCSGILLMIITIPLNGFIIKKLKGLQMNIMAKKDQRIRLTNEVLQGIRVIKFFSWEESFEATITAIRDIELHDLRKAAYLGSIVMFMWMSTPLFVSIVTFTTYVLLGNELTATTAFTSLALFNILRFPLNMLPSVITSMVDANISIKRLHKYLTSPEMDRSAIRRGELTDDGPAISIQNGSFAWSSGQAGNEEKADPSNAVGINTEDSEETTTDRKSVV